MCKSFSSETMFFFFWKTQIFTYVKLSVTDIFINPLKSISETFRKEKSISEIFNGFFTHANGLTNYQRPLLAFCLNTRLLINIINI